MSSGVAAQLDMVSFTDPALLKRAYERSDEV
jgi:hypothetical protein